MVTRLVDDWVPDKELTTGQSGGLSNLRIVVLDISNGNVSDEFVENVPLISVSYSPASKVPQPVPEKSKLPRVCRAKAISASLCSRA